MISMNSLVSNFKKRKNQVLICFAILFCLILLIILGIFVKSALKKPQEQSSLSESSIETQTSTETETGTSSSITTSSCNTTAQTQTKPQTQQTQSTTKATTKAKPSTTTSKASAVPASTAEIGQWNLLLVNPWRTIPENYSINVASIGSGQSVDKRIVSDLQRMLSDCRAAGLSPLVCSSYRTMELQTRLFNRQVNAYKAKGMSEEAAKAEAGKSVARPGTSEHQLGLAVDIVSSKNQNLNDSQERTAEQKWLMENSYKYGFILRYPSNKSSITGIIYEPWHYRYVGKEAAAEIKNRGICLEEYVGFKR